jgi:hypothetical protein
MAGHGRAEGRGKRFQLKRFVVYVPLIILILEHIVYPFYYTEAVLSTGARKQLLSPSNLLESSSARIDGVMVHPSPSEQQLDRSRLKGVSRLGLNEITGATYTKTCPGGFVLIRNDDSNAAPPDITDTTAPRIPMIVHQTAKSRCLTPDISQATEAWHFPGWSYYFHDDDAVLRLFQQEFHEFPYLQDVVQKCLVHGTLKADLWRYMVLWVYGGIYADLDAVPAKLTPDNIIHQSLISMNTTSTSPMNTDTDALFVVEQFHMLSQYFMAVSPRHPLMYYAIQEALVSLLQAPDTGRIAAAMVTGPHALHRAYVRFRNDAGALVDPAGRGYKPVHAGHFVGTYNRSVTVVGVAEHQNEYINRDVLGMHKKKASYQKMGMRHFIEDKSHATGKSCFTAMLPLHLSEADSS